MHNSPKLPGSLVAKLPTALLRSLLTNSTSEKVPSACTTRYKLLGSGRFIGFAFDKIRSPRESGAVSSFAIKTSRVPVRETGSCCGRSLKYTNTIRARYYTFNCMSCVVVERAIICVLRPSFAIEPPVQELKRNHAGSLEEN